jgi:hypothetical protein
MKTIRSILQWTTQTPVFALLAFTLAIAGWHCQPQAQEATPKSHRIFTSFDFPGAIDTQATAITPSGDIVGRYTSADKNLHGFLLKTDCDREGREKDCEGKFKSIDVPNGTQTEVNWINPRGQMVGDYIGVDGNLHGFLLSEEDFTTFDYPGAKNTFGAGISPRGNIVGWETGPDQIPHGFLRTKEGDFSSIRFPGALATLPTMIIGKSIVGAYVDASFAGHGFLLRGGRFQPIDCRGFTQVFLSGLNPQGDLTGAVDLGLPGQHGLLVRDGHCIIVDFPGSLPGSNYANGINPRGDIVGRYATSDGVVHGYLRRVRPTHED